MKETSIILSFLLLIMVIGEELQALQRAKSGLKQLNRQARGAWGFFSKAVHNCILVMCLARPARYPKLRMLLRWLRVELDSVP